MNILAALAADPSVSQELRAAVAPLADYVERADYESALRQFDWSYEFSDDITVWRRGRDALAKLREQQRRLDPSGALWLSIRPQPWYPRPEIVEGAV